MPNISLNLLVALVGRDFQAQYRRSLIGPAWVILQVIVYLSIFILLRNFLSVPSDGKPYPIFAALALVPWTFFVSAINRAGTSAIANGAIIKKVAVMREIFPLAAICLSFVDLLIASLVVITLAFWYELSLNWTVLLLPVVFIILSMAAFGVSLVVAAIGVYRRDIIIVLPYVMQIWMLLSPVAYPLSVVPTDWVWLYSLNPIVGVVEGVRSILLEGEVPDVELLTASFVGSVIILLIGFPFYRKASKYFADAL